MSDRPIIEVENLGKRYRLGATRGGAGGGGASYQTLRESLSQGARRLLPRGRRADGAAASLSTPDETEFWALRDVSFSVRPGEVVGIIGRNGAGKSTLLKILSRITDPTEGRVTLRGRVASLLEVGTGFHPELTGRENIFLNGAVLGMHRKEIKRKFDEIVAFAEVDRFLDTPVKRYSSGMYVRLAFAVAAHLEPEILIVDEVLAVGDAEFQRKCLGKMKQVAQGEGRTVIFVSHNIGAVRQLCRCGLLLQKGLLAKAAPINEVLEDYLSDSIASKDGNYDLAVHPARSRNHQAVIMRVQLLTVVGTPTDTIHTDEAMIVELTLQPSKIIREPRLAVAIEDVHGHRITTLASYFKDDAPLPDIQEACRVRCLLPKVRLGTGRYLLSVSIGDNYSGLLDSVDKAAWFHVVWNDSFARGEPYQAVYGPVLTHSEWSCLAI